MRPKFDLYQPASVRAEFLAFVRQHTALFVVPEINESNLFPQCRDPKDNQFLALIQASNADALISSDADLLMLDPWQGVPILRPGAFLEIVSK